MKVLIVDDDPIVIQSCRRVLELEGIDIHVAMTVEKGEKVLSDQNIDLLLTDIKMPGRDGFEMIARAKKLRPDLPILIMTGYLIPETFEKGRGFGVENYIAKPFTPDELLNALQSTIMIHSGKSRRTGR